MAISKKRQREPILSHYRLSGNMGYDTNHTMCSKATLTEVFISEISPYSVFSGNVELISSDETARYRRKIYDNEVLFFFSLIDYFSL
ncbi:hypothetical protein Y032_0431g1339 [Ancylostoma ceylanicum]|uniref:Uncharacterized protein n=1 Tax=Ancylostoma ceylanicum TaxID=53326 RepID=A0A016X276_9BILA|nr:hypothetical protein Y032_0431g1339 [Ancylostoma ceylanicum]